MDQQIIRAALQQEPADLLLKGGKVLNVFNGTIEEKDVLIKNGRIAYVGKCDPKEAKETVDLLLRYRHADRHAVQYASSAVDGQKVDH